MGVGWFHSFLLRVLQNLLTENERRLTPAFVSWDVQYPTNKIMNNILNTLAIDDPMIKSHRIDDHSVFGDYGKAEDRVTSALLIILRLAGRDLIDRLIDKFGGEGKNPEPEILTQVTLRGANVKGNEPVADGLIISDYAYKIVIESKIAPFKNNLKHNLEQLEKYSNLISGNENEYILYITPDKNKPEELKEYFNWLNWDDIVELLSEYVLGIDNALLIFLIKEFIKLIGKLVLGRNGRKGVEKEKKETEIIAETKMESQTDLPDKNSNVDDEKVLVVGGRWGEDVAVKYDFYACQPDRFFIPTKYMAFYYDNRIKYLFEIILKEDWISDLSDKKWGIDPDYFIHYDTKYNTEEHKERELFKLRLVHIFKDGGIINDSKDKNGKKCAFTQRQRYTTYNKIMSAKYTSEL